MDMFHNVFKNKILDSKLPVKVLGLNKKIQASYVWNLFDASKKNILIVTNTLYEANNLYKDLSVFSDNILLFPMDDFLVSEALAISPDLMAKRIETLNELAFSFDNKIIIGTRGWTLNDDAESKKMINREVLRLELSIKNGIENYGDNKEIIAFMHYPPIVKQNVQNDEANEFIKVLKKYNIKKCYYGHLHGAAIKEAIEGKFFGIEFKLVSADGLGFDLIKVT